MAHYLETSQMAVDADSEAAEGAGDASPCLQLSLVLPQRKPGIHWRPNQARHDSDLCLWMNFYLFSHLEILFKQLLGLFHSDD